MAKNCVFRGDKRGVVRKFLAAKEKGEIFLAKMFGSCKEMSRTIDKNAKIVHNGIDDNTSGGQHHDDVLIDGFVLV
jgi:hypothetical protein